MWALDGKWWKIALSIVVSLAVDIGLHFLWAPSPAYKAPVSDFVMNGWFLPVVMFLLLVTYLALALIFLLIQSKLPGKKLSKGLRYGIAFGGLMFVSSPAMSLLFGSPLEAELRIGFVDGLAICLLGFLFGKLLATDGIPHQGPVFAPLAISVLVVGSTYFILHFVAYLFMPSLSPAYLTQPAGTMAWILGVGLWIGLMNWLFHDAFATGSFVRQAIGFAGITFGLYSVINMFFAPVFVATPIGGLLLDTALGIFCVWVGVWLERVVQQQLISVNRKTLRQEI
jgi:hypothetical protein